MAVICRQNSALLPLQMATGSQSQTLVVQVFDSLSRICSDVSAKSKLQSCYVPRRGKLPWTILQCNCKSGKVIVGYLLYLLWHHCVLVTPTITHHQPPLCRHLMECLERQTMTPISCVNKKSTRLRCSECFRVYCCCHLSESDEMVECKGYHEWTMTCVPFPKIVFI